MKFATGAFRVALVATVFAAMVAASASAGYLDDVKEKATNGDPVAQYSLGRAYERGDGIRRDCFKAVEWYKRSAAQGIGVAAYELAVMYEEGRGIPKDQQMAEYWRSVAAYRGVEISRDKPETGPTGSKRHEDEQKQTDKSHGGISAMMLLFLGLPWKTIGLSVIIVAAVASAMLGAFSDIELENPLLLLSIFLLLLAITLKVVF